MMTPRELSESIHAVLKPAGFRRTGENWRRTSADTHQVVNLQKSEFDEQRFLNIGFWIRSLGPGVSAPRESKCHVRVRGDRIADNSRSEWNLHSVLALSEARLADDERLSLLRDYLEQDLLPFCDTAETLLGLAQLAAQSVLSAAFVHKDARPLLGLL